MVDTAAVKAAQEVFRERVVDWCSAMLDDTVSAEKVNALGKVLRDWVQGLDAQNITREVLLPFLADVDPAFRCGSAIFLLRRGAAEQAVPVLEELADNDDYGPIATRADNALLAYENEQASTT